MAESQCFALSEKDTPRGWSSSLVDPARSTYSGVHRTILADPADLMFTTLHRPSRNMYACSFCRTHSRALLVIDVEATTSHTDDQGLHTLTAVTAIQELEVSGNLLGLLRRSLAPGTVVPFLPQPRSTKRLTACILRSRPFECLGCFQDSAIHNYICPLMTEA